jgi:hypothetical protein
LFRYSTPNFGVYIENLFAIFNQLY